MYRKSEGGDYEARIDVSEAFIHVAMSSLLLRRISHWSHSQTGYCSYKRT